MIYHNVQWLICDFIRFYNYFLLNQYNEKYKFGLKIKHRSHWTIWKPDSENTVQFVQCRVKLSMLYQLPYKSTLQFNKCRKIQ